jgi:DNA polymerase III delta prime subunit
MSAYFQQEKQKISEYKIILFTPPNETTIAQSFWDVSANEIILIDNKDLKHALKTFGGSRRVLNIVFSNNFPVEYLNFYDWEINLTYVTHGYGDLIMIYKLLPLLTKVYVMIYRLSRKTFLPHKKFHDKMKFREVVSPITRLPPRKYKQHRVVSEEFVLQVLHRSFSNLKTSLKFSLLFNEISVLRKENKMVFILLDTISSDSKLNNFYFRELKKILIQYRDYPFKIIKIRPASSIDEIKISYFVTLVNRSFGDGYYILGKNKEDILLPAELFLATYNPDVVISSSKYTLDLATRLSLGTVDTSSILYECKKNKNHPHFKKWKIEKKYYAHIAKKLK